MSTPAISPAVSPIIGAGELPFLMSDAKAADGADAYRKYAEKEMKDVKFCLAFIHRCLPRSHSRLKKVTVPTTPRAGLSARRTPMATFITQLGAQRATGA